MVKAMELPEESPNSVLRRVEQKFFVPPDRLPVAQALIRRTCRWDAEYPEEQINSLYFDTHDLEQHERSLAGDFVKDKVRVRWYGEGALAPTCEVEALRQVTAPRLVPVWVELKSRRGFVSTKQRARTDVAADSLAFDALSRGIVPMSYLLSTIAGFGLLISRRLEPVIVVSYWRSRFVEPCTGFRVSLDSRIRSSVVRPGVRSCQRELELRGAVVEVKGATLALPHCLIELAKIGSSWTRYSKYSSSLDAHGAVLGEVSRLWPAGTMHAEPCTGLRVSRRGVPACGQK